MEEEVNQRVVSLSFNAGRMTAEVAARAMAGFIAAEHQKLNQHAAERSDKRFYADNSKSRHIF